MRPSDRPRERPSERSRDPLCSRCSAPPSTSTSRTSPSAGSAPSRSGRCSPPSTSSSLAAARTHDLRARLGDERLVWGLLGVLAASFVGLAAAGRGRWMLALLLVQAVANGVYSPLTKPLLNREISDSRGRAAILSVESMARRAAMALFAPLVGLALLAVARRHVHAASSR